MPWPELHIKVNMYLLSYFRFCHPAASHQTGETGRAATGNRQPLQNTNETCHKPQSKLLQTLNQSHGRFTPFTSFFSTTSQATCSPSRPLKGISRVNISHRTWKKPTYYSQLYDKESYLCQSMPDPMHQPTDYTVHPHTQKIILWT